MPVGSPHADLPRSEFSALGGGRELGGAEWLLDADFFEPAGAPSHYTLDASPGGLSVAGAAATVVAARNLNAAAASLTASGQPAATTASRTVNAQAGVFAVTGQALGFQRNAVVNATGAAFGVSGQPSSASNGRGLNAGAGTYLTGGQPATLVTARTLDGGAAALSAVGQPATTHADRVVAAQGTPLLITGQNAELLIAVPNRVIAADPGSFLVPGAPATLTRSGMGLNAEPTTFGLLGAPTSRDVARRADSGGLAITGLDATLAHNRVLATSPAGTGYAAGYAADYDGPPPEFSIGVGYAADYTFNYSGTDTTASLLHGRIRSVSPGAFVWAGADTEYVIAQTPYLPADAGLFTMTGTARFLLEVDMQSSSPLTPAEKQEIADLAAAAVLAAMPTTADTAAQVRAELTPELSRLDVRVGTRASQADVFAA